MNNQPNNSKAEEGAGNLAGTTNYVVAPKRAIHREPMEIMHTIYANTYLITPESHRRNFLDRSRQNDSDRTAARRTTPILEIVELSRPGKRQLAANSILAVLLSSGLIPC